MDCDAVVSADWSPCVTAAAGLQSNFPACRSAHTIDKSHSWLLHRGKWSLYCFSETNVGSRQGRSHFQSQGKTTQTHTHLLLHTASHSVKLLFPHFHFSLSLHTKTHLFLLSSPCFPPTSLFFFFFSGLLHFFQGGNFNKLPATESIESCRAIPKSCSEAHLLFLLLYNWPLLCKVTGCHPQHIHVSRVSIQVNGHTQKRHHTGEIQN